jgi:N-methylhydantoinase A
VLVPEVAGLFSAVGLLFARPEFHEVRTCHLDADTCDPAAVQALLDEMEARLAPALAGQRELEWVRSADLRYGGQTWEVETPMSAGPVDRPALTALRARFEDEHERLYGVRDQPGSPVEIRAVRLAALGASATAGNFALDGNGRPPAGSRTMQAGGESVEAPVGARAAIGTAPERGPMLIDEYDTTVVVPPGWTVRREPATGTLVLERSGDG